VLAGAGVTDLKLLATSDPLRLSRETGLSYSKLVRLRALARREPLSARAEAPAAARVERFSPADRPHTEQEAILRVDREFVLEPHAETEGVGGPFA
jgi:hypothetical protein